RSSAAELVKMAPDLIFVATTPALAALHRESQSLPIETAAATFGVQLTRADVRNAAEIERAINDFAQQPNGALVVAPTAVTILHRDLIIALAARHRLPAVYPYHQFATSGGFISYAVFL